MTQEQFEELATEFGKAVTRSEGSDQLYMDPLLHHVWTLDLTLFHSMQHNVAVFYRPDPFDKHRRGKPWQEIQHGGPFQFQLLYAKAFFQHHL